MKLDGLKKDWYDNLSEEEQHIVWEYISWGFTALCVITFFIVMLFL